MKYFSEVAVVALTLVIVGPSVPSRADSFGNVVNLRGVTPPYAIYRFCGLSSGVVWSVGGDGHILVQDVNGVIQERRVGTNDLNGVFFVNEQKGWVVGTKGCILHTKDGGKNWARQGVQQEDDLEAIDCVDTNRCYVVGRSGTVLYTEDSGLSWKKVQTGLSENLYAIDFVNQYLGCIAGSGGVVLFTSDGGRSWRVTRTPLILHPNGPFAGPSPLYAVNVASEQKVFVAGMAGLAWTADGGQSWDIKVSEEHFVGLVRHGQQIWAVGYNDNNYCSKDDGTTWKKCENE